MDATEAGAWAEDASTAQQDEPASALEAAAAEAPAYKGKMGRGLR
jgi:hypothetical protein